MKMENNSGIKQSDSPEDGCLTDDMQYGDLCSSGQMYSGTDRKRRRGVIEKRRRDRINFNLGELRRLVPDAAQKQSSIKLEKAEILQMTVEFLHRIHKEGLVVNTETRLLENRLLGFQECFAELTRFLSATPITTEVDEIFRRKMLSHLHASIYRRDFEARARLASLSVMVDEETRNHTKESQHILYSSKTTRPISTAPQEQAQINKILTPYSIPYQREELNDNISDTLPGYHKDTQGYWTNQKASVDFNSPRKKCIDKYVYDHNDSQTNHEMLWSGHCMNGNGIPSHMSASVCPNESQSTTSPSLHGNFEEIDSGNSANSTTNRCSPTEAEDILSIHRCHAYDSKSIKTSPNPQSMTNKVTSYASSYIQNDNGHMNGLISEQLIGHERQTCEYSANKMLHHNLSSHIQNTCNESTAQKNYAHNYSNYSNVELQPVIPQYIRRETGITICANNYNHVNGKSTDFAYF